METMAVAWLQARITSAIEALEAGDYELAFSILLDLAADVERASRREG